MNWQKNIYCILIFLFYGSIFAEENNNKKFSVEQSYTLSVRNHLKPAYVDEKKYMGDFAADRISMAVVRSKHFRLTLILKAKRDLKDITCAIKKKLADSKGLRLHLQKAGIQYERCQKMPQVYTSIETGVNQKVDGCGLVMKVKLNQPYNPQLNSTTRIIDIAKNDMLRIWIEAHIPKETKPGMYHGSFFIKTKESKSFLIDFKLNVLKEDPLHTFFQEDQAITFPKEVYLTLVKPKGLSLSNWPVVNGIPFPKGELKSTENLVLLGPDCKKISSFQTEILAWWPDGSIKMVNLIFMANSKSNKDPSYLLQYGNEVGSVSPQDSIKIKEDQDSLTINTGPLQFILNKKKFTLFDDVQIDSDKDGHMDTQLLNSPGEILLKIEDKLPWITSQMSEYKIKIEEKGPVRTVIRCSGVYQSQDRKKCLRIIVRFHAYVNSGLVRLFVTFINDSPHGQTIPKWYPILGQYARYGPEIKESYIDMTGLALILKPKITGLNYALGLDKKNYSGKLIDNNIKMNCVNLFQPISYQAKMTFGKKERKGRKADGWINVSNSQGGITAAVRYFWQNSPKELSAKPGELAVWLYPSRKDPRMLDTNYKHEAPALIKNKKNIPYHIFIGEAKTHEVLFNFHIGAFTKSKTEEIMAAFEKNPILRASPEWYSNSRVFGDILPGTQEQMKRPTYFTEYNSPSLHEDWDKPGSKSYYFTWGRSESRYLKHFGDGLESNLEGDRPHQYYLHFIRGFSRLWYDVAERGSQHFMDIDVMHSDSYYVIHNQPGMYFLPTKKDVGSKSNAKILKELKSPDLRTMQSKFPSSNDIKIKVKSSKLKNNALTPKHQNSVVRNKIFYPHHMRHARGKVLAHSFGHTNIVRALFCHSHLGGLTDYYLLSGNKRALEVANEIAEFIATLLLDHQVRNRIYERAYGWSLNTLLQVYGITGNQRYWKALEIIVDDLYNWWQLRGYWDNNPFEFNPDGGDGQTGILLSALIQYLKILPPGLRRDKIRAMTLDCIHYIFKSKKGKFFNKSKQKGRWEPLLLEAFGFAFMETGDKKYYKILNDYYQKKLHYSKGKLPYHTASMWNGPAFLYF